MNPVRVSLEFETGVVEYVVHVVNRSRHALNGALRSAKKRYPHHKSVMAEFVAPEVVRQAEPLRRVRAKLLLQVEDRELVEVCILAPWTFDPDGMFTDPTPWRHQEPNDARDAELVDRINAALTVEVREYLKSKEGEADGTTATSRARAVPGGMIE